MHSLIQPTTELGCFPRMISGTPAQRETSAPEILRDYLGISQSGAIITIERIFALGSDADEDQLLPTLYVLDKACSIIYAANFQIRVRFPRGSADTDGRGGLRVEWRRINHNIGLVRDVRLVIPSSQPNLPSADERQSEYIFHAEYRLESGTSGSGDQYEIEPVSSGVLAKQLEWLLQA